MIAGSAFASLKLEGCSDAEFLFFVGLIVKADDEGRGDGTPAALRMQFPNRRWATSRIQVMLDTIASAGLVLWYRCDCGFWYEIVDWADYQQGGWMGVHQKPSRIPDLREKTCCKCSGTLVLVSGDTPNVSKGNVSKDKMATVFDSDFDEWWSDYPHKVGKPKALSCYISIREQGTPAELLTDALAAYLEELHENETATKYIKHPATFLGPDRSWEDYAKMRGWNEGEK